MSNDQVLASDSKKSSWEKETIQKLLFDNLKEQRRKRRWNIFFKLIYLLLFIFILFLIVHGRKFPEPNRLKAHTALVTVDGTILASGNSSADNVVASLDKAFKDPNSVAVILRINSPGGSPVQADYIFNNIMRFRQTYPHKKIYAVCSDICASAAYYIAVATDNIYADPSSIVGSIGVLLNGFGFVGTMEKLGVERRLITAGNKKGFLDPFSPLNPDDVKITQDMLDTVHQLFIADVRRGRGNRLKETPDIFSGLAWTGVQAKELGLIDGFGSAGDVARNIIKNTTIVDYTKKEGLFNQFSRGLGASFYHEFAADFGLSGPMLR